MSLSELNVFYNETVTLQLMDNIFPKMETNMFIVFVDCVKYLLFPINGVLIIIGLGRSIDRNHIFSWFYFLKNYSRYFNDEKCIYLNNHFGWRNDSFTELLTERWYFWLFDKVPLEQQGLSCGKRRNMSWTIEMKVWQQTIGCLPSKKYSESLLLLLV